MQRQQTNTDFTWALFWVYYLVITAAMADYSNITLMDKVGVCFFTATMSFWLYNLYCASLKRWETLDTRFHRSAVTEWFYYWDWDYWDWD